MAAAQRLRLMASHGVADSFPAMHLLDAYPVIVTPRVRECRDFYIGWFRATTIFEASWFVLLALPGEPACNLAFGDRHDRPRTVGWC
jgi:hypothetical protein